MKIEILGGSVSHPQSDLVLFPVFNKKSGKDKTELVHHLPKDVAQCLEKSSSFKNYKGNRGESFQTTMEDGVRILVWGFGEKEKYDSEVLRREVAQAFKASRQAMTSLALSLDLFKLKGSLENTVSVVAEAILLSNYVFDHYLTTKDSANIKKVSLYTKEKALKKLQDSLAKTSKVVESINFARNLVNEPPNVLHSEEYAKRIQKDAKGLKGVKCKVLGKAELKKEGAGLFLSVNAGSGYEPQLVHLTYTPTGATNKTKHIALVGKGLTFDTGGYSLKPGESMVNMKFDMAGSATVYAAFRAAVLLGLKVKITCVLGITDNAINSFATKPDSIVKGRNGKSVEILNTDAEGRLVLADCLDYACDQKPEVVIDAATLTGACLVALGSEVCGLMGNDQKLVDSLLKSAKATDEYMWQLPVVPEFHKDIKSPIADLKNIGSNRFGGTSKAAAFLEAFIKPGVAWAHLDIAGVGDSQGHLPYCPTKGASGLVVRSLVHYLANV